MKSAFRGLGVVLVALALVALTVQYGPSKGKTGPKRTAHLHAVAVEAIIAAAKG